MKVFLLINSLCCGGAERVSVVLANYLIRQGYSVGLVTLHQSDDDFYTPDPKVVRIYLNKIPHQSRKFYKLLINWKRLLILRRIIATEKPDVLIGMMTTSAVLSIIAGLYLPVKVIVSERNYPERKKASPPWGLLRKIFYRFADAHVAQTHEIASWLQKNTAARNIHIISNSVTWPIPSVPNRVLPVSVIDSESYVLLAIGSKIFQKGLDLLLSAFIPSALSYPNLSLVILGLDSLANSRDYDHSHLLDKISQAGIMDQVYLLGRVGNVADWYKRANVFILSSRYEGFPNVLLEAMASGCACIAFDCETGPREIIRHGLNGLLVPAEDVSALAEAILQLIQDSSCYENIRSNALSVRQQFSEDRVLSQWHDLIHQLVDSEN